MEENYPNVSVIILTYNGRHYLKALLDSLSEQSYPKERVEVIIVDNASNDDTIPFVQKFYPNVKQVALAKNLGFAAGNNRGLQYARHDYLVFLNQDTICHRDWLSGLMKRMVEDDKIGVCTSNIFSPETDEFHLMDKRSLLNTLYYYDLSPFGYGRYRRITGKRVMNTQILSGCSFVIRRELVKQLGYLFDEELWMYVEDTDLSLRIHNLGKHVCVTRDSVVYHLHDSNMQVRADRVVIAARAIINRVHVFFMNMGALEFFLFSPFLFLGGIFKILEFRMSTVRKTIFFIPFSLFSMACMIFALFRLPKFKLKKMRIMKKRRTKGFHILKLVLNYHP